MATPNQDLIHSASEPALLDGQLIADKYRVEEKIAEGGMGVVYRARHLDLDQLVAIKVVRPDLAHSELVIARFLNEARSAARLRSLHVARVLDAGRLPNGLPYLAMEFLEGADLCAVLLREGPLPVSVAVDYLLQACQAVAEAHAAGIIHRDLKPENLFLTSGVDGAPVIKVLDFGISKQLSGGPRSLTNPACGVGSPHYMAPEQMRSPESVDQRADLWSLGAVLYELLTGSPPFDGETLPIVCARVLGEMPAALDGLRPDVPPELESVVLKALEKDPRARFASVAEFSQALERCKECESPLATNRTPTPSFVSLPYALSRPLSREQSPASGVPVCSVRVRARSLSDSTPAPHVQSIEIPGVRRSRAPLIVTVVAFAALTGYASARWTDLGSDTTDLGRRLQALRTYLVEFSAAAIPAFDDSSSARPAGRSSDARIVSPARPNSDQPAALGGELGPTSAWRAPIGAASEPSKAAQTPARDAPPDAGVRHEAPSSNVTQGLQVAPNHDGAD